MVVDIRVTNHNPSPWEYYCLGGQSIYKQTTGILDQVPSATQCPGLSRYIEDDCPAWLSGQERLQIAGDVDTECSEQEGLGPGKSQFMQCSGGEERPWHLNVADFDSLYHCLTSDRLHVVFYLGI